MSAQILADDGTLEPLRAIEFDLAEWRTQWPRSRRVRRSLRLMADAADEIRRARDQEADRDANPSAMSETGFWQ